MSVPYVGNVKRRHVTSYHVIHKFGDGVSVAVRKRVTTDTHAALAIRPCFRPHSRLAAVVSSSWQAISPRGRLE
eukprot:2630454-Prymnesium_polylepis.1